MRKTFSVFALSILLLGCSSSNDKQVDSSVEKHETVEVSDLCPLAGTGWTVEISGTVFGLTFGKNNSAMTTYNTEKGITEVALTYEVGWADECEDTGIMCGNLILLGLDGSVFKTARVVGDALGFTQPAAMVFNRIY